MFEVDRFVEDCRAAAREDQSHKAVREVVARAMAERSQVIDALGEPRDSGVHKLYAGDDLTVLNIVWAPLMTVPPHNHEMWGVIGIYSGREDNVFWRRIADDGEGRIEAAGAKALCEGDATPLGRDVIHSVTNPISRFTGAIQIYGGNFFTKPRSQWDPQSLVEAPFDLEATLERFRMFGDMAAAEAAQ
jgi:predicted metal-dependent enzyme (double-stranded beta helix superfamily)